MSWVDNCRVVFCQDHPIFFDLLSRIPKSFFVVGYIWLYFHYISHYYHYVQICIDSYGLISGKSWSWSIIWLKKCCHQGGRIKNKFINWYSLLCVWRNWTWILVLDQASKEFVEKDKIPTWGVLRTNKGLPISKSEKPIFHLMDFNLPLYMAMKKNSFINVHLC